MPRDYHTHIMQTKDNTLHLLNSLPYQTVIRVSSTITHMLCMSLSSVYDICSIQLCVSTFLIIHHIVSDPTIWTTGWSPIVGPSLSLGPKETNTTLTGIFVSSE